MTTILTYGKSYYDNLPKTSRFVIERWRVTGEITDKEGLFPGAIWWQIKGEKLQFFVRPKYMHLPHPTVPNLTCNEACAEMLSRIDPRELTSPLVHHFLTRHNTEDRKFLGIFKSTMCHPAPLPLMDRVIIEKNGVYYYNKDFLDTSY